MRYMWIPHTDTVVVVTCDPLGEGDGGGAPPPPVDEAWATEPLRELLLQRAPEQATGAPTPSPPSRLGSTSAPPGPHASLCAPRRPTRRG